MATTSSHLEVRAYVDGMYYMYVCVCYRARVCLSLRFAVSFVDCCAFG